MTKLTVDHIADLEASLTPEQTTHATAMFLANGWRPGDYIPLYVCQEIFSKAASQTQETRQSED